MTSGQNEKNTIGTILKAGAGASNPLVAAAILAGTVGLDYFGKQNQIDVANQQYAALTGYLNKLDADRAQARGYMQDNFDTADKQFNQEANTPLPELGQMKNDITQQATDAQQENQKEFNAQLAMNGVRGGQAATLAGRQTGELNRELNWDVNKLGYDEASNRENARLNYTGQKALIPYQTLNTAQWLYMPSDTEKQLMTNAINQKFGTTANNQMNYGSYL